MFKGNWSWIIAVAILITMCSFQLGCSREVNPIDLVKHSELRVSEALTTTPEEWLPLLHDKAEKHHWRAEPKQDGVYLVSYVGEDSSGWFWEVNTITQEIRYLNDNEELSGLYGISASLESESESIHRPIASGPESTAGGDAEIATMSTLQSGQGYSKEDLDTEAAKRFENWLVETQIEKASAYLSQHGFKGPHRRPEVKSSSSVVIVDGSRYVFVRTLLGGQSQAAFVIGFSGNDLVRVTCTRKSSETIPISYGPCATEIFKSFGVKFAQ